MAERENGQKCGKKCDKKRENGNGLHKDIKILAFVWSEIERY